MEKSNIKKKYCECCNKVVSLYNYSKHKKSKIHIENYKYMKEKEESEESDNDRCEDYEKYIMRQYDYS